MNFLTKTIVYGVLAYALLITVCVVTKWLVGLYIVAGFLVCDVVSFFVIRRRLSDG